MRGFAFVCLALVACSGGTTIVEIVTEAGAPPPAADAGVRLDTPIGTPPPAVPPPAPPPPADAAPPPADANDAASTADTTPPVDSAPPVDSGPPYDAMSAWTGSCAQCMAITEPIPPGATWCMGTPQAPHGGPCHFYCPVDCIPPPATNGANACGDISWNMLGDGGNAPPDSGTTTGWCCKTSPVACPF